LFGLGAARLPGLLDVGSFGVSFDSSSFLFFFPLDLLLGSVDVSFFALLLLFVSLLLWPILLELISLVLLALFSVLLELFFDDLLFHLSFFDLCFLWCFVPSHD